MKLTISSIRRTSGAAVRRRGFTLVEMLLVVVIIGILAAIVLPKITGRGEDARIAAANAQLASFKSALNTFELDNGHYPRGNNGLQELMVRPRDSQRWRGPYLDSPDVPKDPWGNDYIYEYPGRNNENSYDLYSVGPDGQSGTDDDISNWKR